MINYIIGLLIFFLFDFIYFVVMAKICGKLCNYDCDKCKNWACTHGTKYEGKGCYPVIDYSKWCLKKVK